ncbi:MAG: hypothetical protein K2N05_09510 [Muribaculaceae bacterium]|nr:hypothetical protein [Muribaculaceae bacterium]
MKGLLINLLKERAGCDVTTPAGSEWLCKDIEVRTGQRLSVNTVKRLSGVIDSDEDNNNIHARRSTMDIISQYLGFRDYVALHSFLEQGSSSFRTKKDIVEMSELPVGARVVLGWALDREISVVHEGDGCYRVCTSKKSKLMEGDRLFIHNVMKGYPLYVRNVIRNGESLGNYTAAMEYGVAFVRIEHDQPSENE